MPERFGPWQTVYGRPQRWSADGTWARLLSAAQTDADARGELDWLVAADSSLMRVHQHGASARRFGGNAATAAGPARAVPCRGSPRPVLGSQGARSNYKKSRAEPAGGVAISEPDCHAVGRSRDGLTTKLHLLTDGAGRPLVLVLTAGNVNDTTMFDQLMAGVRVPRNGRGRPRTRPDYVLGDKGYNSRANRELLRRRGIAHTVPEPADQAAHRRRRGRAGSRPVGFDKARHRRRNVVERGFCQLKQWRGLATRSDEYARNYLGAATLAALLARLR